METTKASERAKAEEAMSLLKATLDSTADGILVVDSLGKIVSFNSNFVRMWGIPADIIEQRDDDRAISYVLGQLKDPNGFLRKVRELYDKPEEESFDILEFQNGRVFERYSRPQMVGKLIVGRVWSFRDVTEKRLAEEVLRKQTEELARSNKELKQFASIVAHDIQEPLHIIGSFAERLLKMTAGRLDDKETDYLSRILKAAGRVGKFTQDLLAYSKVAAKEKIMESVKLGDVVAEVLQDLDPMISESRIWIEADPLPEVQADRTQMRQLFQNLISNAIKFTQKVSKPHVTIRSRCLEDGSVEIIVGDNGVGFEPKFAEHIFEPFERLHDREDYPGSGMGLAVCRKIVERHNGVISAQGTVGAGATFKIVFPF